MSLLGCGGGSSTTSSETTVAPTASPWVGAWQTNFGPVGLVVSEDDSSQIIGAYEYEQEDRVIRGALMGQVQGNALDVQWQDEPGGLGSGHARFTLNSDGSSWTGTWGREGSYTDGGDWSGQLVSR